MVRSPLLGAAVAVLLGACSTVPGPTRPTLSDRELLLGVPLQEPDLAAPITAAEASGLDINVTLR